MNDGGIGRKRAGTGFFENLVESDAWLTAFEAAHYLRMSVNALRIATSRGRVPFYKLGRSVRYKKSEIHALPQAEPFENVLERGFKKRK